MNAQDFRPQPGPRQRMSRYLGRIATGPELSKDLDRDEARDGMELVLDGSVDEAQAAVFLIALRMKRESHQELAGVLDALRARASVAEAAVDELVDIADPYNGYVRHLPAVAFVPAVLAACGVPCTIHGTREAGPKWGLTPHRILRAAGLRVDVSATDAAAAVERFGWAYIDMAQFCPALDALARLRSSIVKRPCLSLLEKMVAPVRVASGGKQHLWVGYAHRAYHEILRDLAREFAYDSMLAVRGVEAGALTSISGRARGVSWFAGDELQDIIIDAPGALGQVGELRAPSLPATPEDMARGEIPSGASGPPSASLVEFWARSAADAGLAALAGAQGMTADFLTVGAAAVLRHLGRVGDLSEGAAMARRVLADGSARERFAAWPVDTTDG